MSETITDETAGKQLIELVEEGWSPAEALDYWAVEIVGYRAAEWARTRDRTRGAVGQNVRAVRDERGE